MAFDWLSWECFPVMPAIPMQLLNSIVLLLENFAFTYFLCFSYCEKTVLSNSKSKIEFFFGKTISIKLHWFLHSMEWNCIFSSIYLEEEIYMKKFQNRCYFFAIRTVLTLEVLKLYKNTFLFVVIPNQWFSIAPLECDVMWTIFFTTFKKEMMWLFFYIFSKQSQFSSSFFFFPSLFSATSTSTTWSSYETHNMFSSLTAGVLSFKWVLIFSSSFDATKRLNACNDHVSNSYGFIYESWDWIFFPIW